MFGRDRDIFWCILGGKVRGSGTLSQNSIEEIKGSIPIAVASQQAMLLVNMYIFLIFPAYITFSMAAWNSRKALR